MHVLEVQFPALRKADAEIWPLLFELASDYPRGWAVVGAQMVILHVTALGLSRPLRTQDTDILVDLQTMSPEVICQWLLDHDFNMDRINPFGVAHIFRRSGLRIDVLATDHAGPRTPRTTIPPARTVEVPGGRKAVSGLTAARVTIEGLSGDVPVPDWVGALILKARAATVLPDPEEKHLTDFALLLGLPVDARRFAETLTSRERRQLQRAIDRIHDSIWNSVAGNVDPRAGRAAARLVGRLA